VILALPILLGLPLVLVSAPDSPDTIPALLGAFGTPIVVAGALLWVWCDSWFRYRQAMRQVARQLSLSYRDTVTPNDVARFLDLPFFRLTAECRYDASFFLWGEVDGIKLRLLELAYSGNFPRAIRRECSFNAQQLLALLPAVAALPDFHLSGQDNDWDTLLPDWPHQLDLGPVAMTLREEDEVLVVHAPDPRPVRRLFRRARRSGLPPLSGWTVECHGGDLLIYRHACRIPESDLLPFLLKALDITRVLAESLDPAEEHVQPDTAG
jgi:hypothetical protein